MRARRCVGYVCVYNMYVLYVMCVCTFVRFSWCVRYACICVCISRYTCYVCTLRMLGMYCMYVLYVMYVRYICMRVCMRVLYLCMYVCTECL